MAGEGLSKETGQEAVAARGGFLSGGRGWMVRGPGTQSTSFHGGY